MIKINRSSWHYRYMAWAGADIPYDLCRYVRKLLLYMIITAGFTTLGLFVAGGMLYAPVVLVGLVPNPIGEQATVLGLMVILGGAGWALAGLVGFAGLYKLIRAKIKARRYTGPFTPRKPSLLAEYLRAKKSKLCPLLEFTDNE